MEKHFSGSMNSKTFMKLDKFQLCIICDFTDKIPALGTGFCFLKSNWIITAKHVAMDDGLVRDNLTAVFVINDDENVRLKLKMRAIHKECDVCILEIIEENNPCEKPLYPGYDNLNSSKGIIFCGYDSDVPSLRVEHVTDFKVTSRQRENEEFILEFNSKYVKGGFSGGPIFGDGGSVLGVMINLINSSDNIDKKVARATSIKTLMDAVNININSEYMNVE